ncbi:MAG: hypothetical protein MUC94_16975, partial [bacterium]|nr:hypothetical protein [bacterium]
PSDESFFKKKQMYFAFERDPLIAKNIQIFLDDHPDFKAIIFYGGMHLLREKVNKNHYINNPIIKDNLYSFCLAHYLDSLYTRNKVRVFCERPIFDFQYENILKIPTATEAPDYYVSMKPYPNHALPMLFARSKTYLSALHEVVSKYKANQSEAEIRMYQNLVLKLTNAICHTYLSEKIEHQKDLRSLAEAVLEKSAALLNEYDTVESLNRIEAGLSLNIMPDDSYYQELVKMLSNIPSLQIDYQGTNAIEKGQLTPDLKQKIANLKGDISTYLAIHNLFIADQKECELIISYLKAKLNLNYQTRMEWFEWWQGKYLPK